MRAPARQVVSKQLNRAERALATPQRDRVGDVGAQRPGIARKMTRAEKIADVRNYPVIRGLDKEIVIKLFNVLVNVTVGLLDQREIRLELIGQAE